MSVIVLFTIVFDYLDMYHFNSMHVHSFMFEIKSFFNEPWAFFEIRGDDFLFLAI